MPQPQRMIDLQLPLPWLLSSIAAVMMFMAAMVWSVAGQSNKLEQLIISTAKLEKRLDERDSRVDLIKENQSEQRITLSAHAMRLEALERARK